MCIGVEGVAFHMARLVPAWVLHHRYRGVEVTLVGTTRDAHCMVLENVVVEQQVEPVGVAHFGFAQISVAGLGCVSHSIGSGNGIIGVEQVIHLAIDTGVRRTYERSKLEPALGFHFLVDTHLLLRVADVVVTVVGLQAIGELTCIVDRGVAGTTRLGRHNNHTCHCLGTVDRGCRTVFQNLEACDIVGIQTSDCRGDQRHSVTRREVVGTDFYCVLKHHAIDNPQRLRCTID